jgi:hypothetical protein
MKILKDFIVSGTISASNLSGTNTGDQDLSNLVVKNASITGATKTKITYDSKNREKTDNSLGSLFVSVLGHDRDVAEFEKLFSDGYLRLIEK